MFKLFEDKSRSSGGRKVDENHIIVRKSSQCRHESHCLSTSWRSTDDERSFFQEPRTKYFLMSKRIDCGNNRRSIINILGVYFQVGNFIKPKNPLTSLQLYSEVNESRLLVSFGEFYFLHIGFLFPNQQVIKGSSFFEFSVSRERPTHGNKSPFFHELRSYFVCQWKVRKVLVILNYSLYSFPNKSE